MTSTTQPPLDALPSEVESARPLRSDAERNRRLILDAAAVVFAERGLLAGFDEVARVAGVGVGTVYRRFPDRDDLIDALFAERVEEMGMIAREAADNPDPWEGLAWFMERSTQAQANDRGLAEVLGDGERGHARLERARERLQPAVGVLVDRAHADGVLRQDIGVVDLALLGNLLRRASTEAAPELWRRYLPVVLDGLRAREHAEPLPLAAPAEDLARVAHAT